jgi:membrane protease YdiL (CAAX protease family)
MKPQSIRCKPEGSQVAPAWLLLLCVGHFMGGGSSVIANLLHAVWSFPLTRFFVFVLILLLTLIFTEPMLLSILSGFGVKGTLPLLLFSEIYHLIFCLGLFVIFVRFIERAKLEDFGFKTENAAKNLFLGAGFGTFLVVLMVLVMYAMGVYHPVKINSAHDLLLSAITLLFAAATEELIFRAYFLTILEKHWGTIAAIVVSSLGFGFAHILNEAGGAAVAEKLLFCTFLSLEAGLSLAACYVFTRDIWMAITAHWMWNYFEGPIFGTHVSGADFGKSLIDASLTGPDLLTGGKFGPEGNLVCLLVGTVGGIALLYLASKRNHLISNAQARGKHDG